MPTKLYVGNIPAQVSSRELTELFEKYGKVLECDIIKDYAFVHMEDSSKAKASIAALNDFNLNGNRIKVEMSITQSHHSSRPPRREDESRHQSSSSIRSSRNRDYPTISSSSSSRNGHHSSSSGGGGGGGPDRSYPSMRNSYMEKRSRPYDSPYERQRMGPPSSTNYSDAYSMRNPPLDSYNRDDFYHPRGSTMSMGDPYGRGAPMRSDYASNSRYSSRSTTNNSSRSRYAASPSPPPPPPPSSRYESGRYASPSRSSSSSRRPPRRSPPPPPPPPPPPSSSSRSRR